MKFRDIFAIFLFIFLVGCGDNDNKGDIKEPKTTKATTEPSLSQNLNAPFSIEFINGDTYSMMRKENGFDMGNGKHATLFVYWATWCPPCIVEIKPLNDLAQNFGKNLKIIGVLVNDPINDDELKNFIEKNKITYDITRDSETLIKTIGDLKGIPYMVLYNEKGVYDRHYFGVIAEEMLQKDIERLVQSEQKDEK